GHSGRFARIVVARSADDHPAGCARVRLPAVVRAVGIRAERGRGPLPIFAGNVLNAVGASPDWPAVVASRCFLPLSLGRQAPSLPRAVVPGSEPRDVDHGPAPEPRIGDPTFPGPVYPRGGTVHVVAGLGPGRSETSSVQELRELGVRHPLAIDPEVAHVDAVQRRLLRRAVVAPHPEGAGLDQHHAVGAAEGGRGEEPRGQKAGSRAASENPHGDHGIVGPACVLAGTKPRRISSTASTFSSTPLASSAPKPRWGSGAGATPRSRPASATTAAATSPCCG